jgi:hypothetical protein
MIFINGVAFEKVFNIVWIVSCTAPLHRTYTINTVQNSPLNKEMLKCDDDVIIKNTTSMHRGPEEGFLCCMRSMTANIFFIRSCWTEMLARSLGHIIILVHFRSKR